MAVEEPLWWRRMKYFMSAPSKRAPEGVGSKPAWTSLMTVPPRRLTKLP